MSWEGKRESKLSPSRVFAWHGVPTTDLPTCPRSLAISPGPAHWFFFSPSRWDLVREAGFRIWSRPHSLISARSLPIVKASGLLPAGVALNLFFYTKPYCLGILSGAGKLLRKARGWRTHKLEWQCPAGGGRVAIRWAQNRLPMSILKNNKNLFIHSNNHFAITHILSMMFLVSGNAIKYVHSFWKSRLTLWCSHSEAWFWVFS